MDHSSVLVQSENILMDSSIETLNRFKSVLETNRKSLLRGDFHRSDLLPLLFRLRGKPFSLSDYPQFREMYPDYFIPDTVFMCGRQIGKTLNLSRSEVLDMLTIPHLQLLYVAPLQSQTQRYSTIYLNEAISSCEFARYLQTDTLANVIDSDSKIVKAVHHQAFLNGSALQLTYAKTSSDRARGIYADRIDFDEIQDQLVDNIPVISESLTASSMGARRFTGTAKTTDNTIEKLWQDSSQCEWAMPCNCKGGDTGKYWNIPNIDGKVMDMIHADGVHCINCGKLLNVRDGMFVPAFPDRMGLFRGYHIPQIVVPAIVENPDKWSALIRKITRYPTAMTLQEVLGISCSLGARLITQQDIDRYSDLPTVLDLQKKVNQYVWTVGGIDWGIAEQDSFTVHTIIGVRNDGRIDVLWARRFVGFDPDEVLKEIAQAHQFYNCRMLAADFGMGFDKNVILEQRFGLPIVQIMYVKQNRLLQYNPILGHHRWTVDKTTALELLFMGIKYGRIHFPPKEEFAVYTGDLLSPYEESSESGGMNYRHFVRNPNRPDDFAHALCFATLLAMRLMGANLVDVIPDRALNSDDLPGQGLPPTVNHIDPNDILTALKI